MQTKTYCFDGLISLFWKNMRSEKSVSGLVSMGFFSDLSDFDAKNGGNERRFERYAFSLIVTCLFSHSNMPYLWQREGISLNRGRFTGQTPAHRETKYLCKRNDVSLIAKRLLISTEKIFPFVRQLL
jgi:hypothetical protein